MASDRLSWRELVPGAVLATLIVLLVYAILRYAQVGGLRGDSYVVYAPVSGARGVMKGTEVWLEGHKVGIVDGLRFSVADTSTGGRLMLRLRVLEEYRSLVRRDSYAQIRSGGTLVGQPVVFVSVGTPATPMLAAEDTLTTLPQVDVEGITSQVALASQQFPAIIANVRVLASQLSTAEGTAGALLGERSMQRVSVVGGRLGAVVREATEGGGSVALAMRALDRGEGPMARAQSAMAQADTLQRLLNSPAGNLGRFRRDSTLLRQVGQLRDEISIVRALLDESRGTAGRALHDRAVFEELTRLERELGALMADLKRRPLRYVHF